LTRFQTDLKNSVYYEAGRVPYRPACIFFSKSAYFFLKEDMDSREKKQKEPRKTAAKKEAEAPAVAVSTKNTEPQEPLESNPANSPTPQVELTETAAELSGDETGTSRPAVKTSRPSVVSSSVQANADQAVHVKAESAEQVPIDPDEDILEIPGINEAPVKKFEAETEGSATAGEVDLLAAMSPVDRLLALPELPPLERENRARLQMQTPTRLYFYWSLREDPWTILRKAFSGDTGSYTLVLKLVELRSETEQIHTADAEGNWWFDVRPDGEYQAEIGFYAPNRPYFRIVYSNIVETPRKKPSPRKAAEAEWTVTADRFAQVLDVAGFTQDAVDVAIAGDNLEASATAIRAALRDLTGDENVPIGVDDEDIRFAMVEMAAGQKLDDLRWRISADLFAYLQSNEQVLDGDRTKAVLNEHFEIDDFTLDTEEFGPAVFGASLVNFPRTIRSRQTLRRSGPGYTPESSHSYRRPSGRS
jgi:hypothetical protein